MRKYTTIPMLSLSIIRTYSIILLCSRQMCEVRPRPQVKWVPVNKRGGKLTCANWGDNRVASYRGCPMAPKHNKNRLNYKHKCKICQLCKIQHFSSTHRSKLTNFNLPAPYPRMQNTRKSVMNLKISAWNANSVKFKKATYTLPNKPWNRHHADIENLATTIGSFQNSQLLHLRLRQKHGTRRWSSRSSKEKYTPWTSHLRQPTNPRSNRHRDKT